MDNTTMHAPIQTDVRTLNIHAEIYDKLKYFINIEKIPNIIFHGPSGSGKRTLVNNFIKMIYKRYSNLNLIVLKCKFRVKQNKPKR